MRENISAYGGDPNNVTIFGESAGGWSVESMLSSEHTKEVLDIKYLKISMII